MSSPERAPLVYVVDDDDAFRDSLRWLLVSEGYRVEGYESAEAFLAAFQPDLACCLVLDVRLPGISGLELQRELVRRGSSLPVIFVTAHGDARIEAEALHHGALCVLYKPFQHERLLTFLEKAHAQAASPR